MQHSEAEIWKEEKKQRACRRNSDICLITVSEVENLINDTEVVYEVTFKNFPNA